MRAGEGKGGRLGESGQVQLTGYRNAAREPGAHVRLLGAHANRVRDWMENLRAPKEWQFLENVYVFDDGVDVTIDPDAQLRPQTGRALGEFRQSFEAKAREEDESKAQVVGEQGVEEDDDEDVPMHDREPQADGEEVTQMEEDDDEDDEDDASGGQVLDMGDDNAPYIDLLNLAVYQAALEQAAQYADDDEL